MANVGGDTWCQPDIVQCELSDAGIELKQQREGLADTTSGAQDGDLGGLHKI
jgi:hypothetical protein